MPSFFFLFNGPEQLIAGKAPLNGIGGSRRPCRKGAYLMSTQNQHRAPQHAEHTRKSSMEAHGTSSHQGEGTTFDRDIPSDRRSEATAQQSIRGSAFDEAYTSGRPPWDISQPQPAFVALAQAGRITGKVLDVGCGTGE